MGLITIFGIAIGLAMDAFAVSISCGFCIRRNVFRNAINAGITFGFFQAGMTYLGWAAGLLFRNAMQAYNHWIAFGLLTIIGIKMIIEAYKENGKPIVLTGMKMLITLAVATSIDALAAGLSFSTLNKDIILPMIIIGIIALLFSFGGVYLGKAVRSVGNFGRKIDMIGGVILIAMGIKILLEHTILNAFANNLNNLLINLF
ncbi:MAG: manganese efflux pump [Clostridiales bacterium]|nr:manganese efflux pump [Clostridiales bacterium]